MCFDKAAVDCGSIMDEASCSTVDRCSWFKEGNHCIDEGARARVCVCVCVHG